MQFITCSKAAENILIFMNLYEETYATEISKLFDKSLNAVQKQFEKYEDSGMFVSVYKGRTRIFKWNPRWIYQTELRALITKIYDNLPDSEKKKYIFRRRPRRRGKK